MTIKPPSACRTQNCNGYAVDRGYCAKCAAAQPVITAQNYARPNAKIYGNKRWRDLRALMIARNPVCQVLLADGTQCTNPSSVVHHKIDPQVDVTLAYNWRNLVCVCASHHTHSAGDAGILSYAPTRNLDVFGNEEFQIHPVGKKTEEAYLSSGRIVDNSESILRAEHAAKLAKQASAVSPARATR
jgi:hypothetical protein